MWKNGKKREIAKEKESTALVDEIRVFSTGKGVIPVFHIDHKFFHGKCGKKGINSAR